MDFILPLASCNNWAKTIFRDISVSSSTIEFDIAVYCRGSVHRLSWQVANRMCRRKKMSLPAIASFEDLVSLMDFTRLFWSGCDEQIVHVDMVSLSKQMDISKLGSFRYKNIVQDTATGSWVTFC